MQDSYILTDISGQPVAFPAAWVAEILTIERDRILKLPFYRPALLGLLQHQGKIVSIVSIEAQVLDLPAPARRLSTETLSALYLSEQADKLAGVAIAVDRVLQSAQQAQLADIAAAEARLANRAVQTFTADWIADDVWQLCG
jgi:chemotaxis signal transduction protein